MDLLSKSSHDPPCQNTSKQSLQVEEENFGRAWEKFKPNTNSKSSISRIRRTPFIQELQYFSKVKVGIYLSSFFHSEKVGFSSPVIEGKLQYSDDSVTFSYRHECLCKAMKAFQIFEKSKPINSNSILLQMGRSPSPSSPHFMLWGT